MNVKDFGHGRRRPLLYRNDVGKENPGPVAPLYMRFDDELDLSPLGKSNNSTDKKRKRTSSGPEDNPHKILPLIEVDLHIYELVDSTAGMDNFTILQYQLDIARQTMKKNRRRIGQKIVFIHGKGDGVLRNALRKLLRKEYASCDVQDASFLKYGFGATLVIIHQ